MNYEKIKKKVDLKFNKKFKYIMSILCMIVFLIATILTPKWVKACSQKDETSKVGFHVKLLNYALPTVKVVNNNLEKSNSHKKSFFKSLDLSSNFSKFVLKKEVSMIGNEKGNSENDEQSMGNDKDDKEKGNGESKEIYNENGELVVDPFKLKEDEIIDNDVSDKNTVSPVYDPKLKKQLNVNKPEILIYHTHTCESYKPGKASSEDKSVNICAVGDVMTNELMNNYGISVIHDKTVYPYNNCYPKSGETVDKYLKKYGQFKLIIDLHRDSISKKNVVTTKLNGEDVARYMFVLEKNNSNYKSNAKVTNDLIGISDKLYPNLIRQCKITEYKRGKGHFNQHKSPNSVLIELGSYVNTTEEAKRTAQCISRIIAEYINKK